MANQHTKKNRILQDAKLSPVSVKTADKATNSPMPKAGARAVKRLPGKRLSELERLRVVSLLLAGHNYKDVAAKAGTTEVTAASVNKRLREQIASMDRGRFRSLLADRFLASVDHHKLTTAELIDQFITTQTQRSQAVDRLAEINDIIPASEAGGEVAVKAANKAEVEIRRYDRRLSELSGQISKIDKDFTDLISRMGVPQAAVSDDKESHPDSPAGVVSVDSEVYTAKTEAEVNHEIEMSARRQLAYLEGLKQQKVSEKSGEGKVSHETNGDSIGSQEVKKC